MHYQMQPKAQGKLIRALGGEIYDVAVDIRKGSPTLANGAADFRRKVKECFMYRRVLPMGLVSPVRTPNEYMTTEEYAPDFESGVIWNDPDLAINWPSLSPYSRSETAPAATARHGH